MTDPVYLDNAATTPLDPRVLEAMLAHLGGARGNPSSLHALGAAARDAVEGARASVAACRGLAGGDRVHQRRDRVRRPGRPRTRPAGSAQRSGTSVVSGVEHAAVREDARRLQKEGFEVSWIGVDCRRPHRPGRVRRGAAPRYGARRRDLGEQRGRHRRARRSSWPRHVPRGASRFTPTPSRRRAGSPSTSAGRRSRRWPSPGTSSTARRASAPCTCETASGLSPSSSAADRRRA